MSASIHSSGKIRGWLLATPTVGRLVAPVFAAHDVWRQRRALAELDDHRLDDLGLTRRDAAREAARPIWDQGPSIRR